MCFDCVALTARYGKTVIFEHLERGMSSETEEQRKSVGEKFSLKNGKGKILTKSIGTIYSEFHNGIETLCDIICIVNNVIQFL